MNILIILPPIILYKQSDTFKKNYLNYPGVTMRNLTEITRLLSDLDSVNADDLEDQDLDFKEWDSRSKNDAIAHVIEMVICMAN